MNQCEYVPMTQTGWRAKLSAAAHRCLASRFGGLCTIAVVFFIASFVLRTVLLIWSIGDSGLGLGAIVRLYLVGAVYDVAAYFYCMIPVAIYVIFLPGKLWRSRFNRYVCAVVYAVFLLAILFDVTAEWFFWEEFRSRFNFVAVDYLVYTQEVMGNIVESYPIVAIFGIMAVLWAVCFFLTRKYVLAGCRSESTFRDRIRPGLVYLMVPVLSLFFLDSQLAETSSNRYANELAKNGVHSIAAAFRSNRITYEDFYMTRDTDEIFARMKELVRTDNSRFLNRNDRDLARKITYVGPAKDLNVVVFVVESLSAKFMGKFGNQSGLTPNLDALCEDSLVFTRLYATGTRTVRGLEAIAMSLPPTPGRSIMKRPDHGILFSLPGIFLHRGYDVTFAYGGHGYFDNMNEFFRTHGAKIVDRSDFSSDDVSFTNAWGVCDGDLLGKVLAESDASHAGGKRFFSIVMTTSNHRPYTYPDVIDIPSGTGRYGAVKYTDYAFGDFFRKARTRPWFDNTVFVIIADHCANSAGKTEVAVDRYHIPMIIYAPGIVSPGKCETLCSQMDVGPTLLGLLNVSYTSKFFGRDVLNSPPKRALLGTYQKLGYYADDVLTVLEPNMKANAFTIGQAGEQRPCEVPPGALLDAISYYQTASYALRDGLYGPESQP